MEWIWMMYLPETGVVLEDIVAVELVAERNIVSLLLLGGTRCGGGEERATHRVNHVAFGSGFAGSAISNIVSDSEVSKFRPSFSAWMTTSSVRFRPSRLRKPWFASVFIIGQGPRAV